MTELFYLLGLSALFIIMAEITRISKFFIPQNIDDLNRKIKTEDIIIGVGYLVGIFSFIFAIIGGALKIVIDLIRCFI